MNKRIQELIEQAHEQKPVIVLDPETCQPTHKIGNGGVPMYHRELNLEKFAELIVRECLDCIAKVHKTEEFNEGYTLGVERCFYKIEEHFFDEEHFFGVLE